MRRQRHGAERSPRKITFVARSFDGEVAIEPAVGGAFVVGRARLHVILGVEVRARRAWTADGLYRRQHLPIVKRLERRQRRMQPEESVEIDRAAGNVAQRLRNRDRGPHRVVSFLAVRHDDVQSVSSSTLEQADQHFPLWSVAKRHAERSATQEARTESHRHQRQRARFHECSAFHLRLLVPLKFRRAECESDDLRNSRQLRNVAKSTSL